MKKTLGFCALGLLLALPTNASAQQEFGGFTGPSAVAPTTVSEALQKADDTAVELTGKIEKSLGDEKYQFTDETGSAVVEIDNEDFRGVSINENDTVTIKGKVDNEFMVAPVIDVDTIEKVQ
jgi:uncharacterized protein (TIGR00156 family)